MVWGGVGLGHKSDLIFIDGTLTGQGYINRLKDDSIFEEMKWAFGDSRFSFPVRRCFTSDSKKDQEIL
jgi:hypothetical protein